MAGTGVLKHSVDELNSLGLHTKRPASYRLRHVAWGLGVAMYKNLAVNPVVDWQMLDKHDAGGEH